MNGRSSAPRLPREIGSTSTNDGTILAHPALVQLFEQKVARLAETLNDPAIRQDSANTLRSLLDIVTIHVDGVRGGGRG